MASQSPVNGDQLDVVMMTPVKKELNHTVLRVERVPPEELPKLLGQQTTNGGGASTNGTDNGNSNRHVAGGQHQGIIVNKQLGLQQTIQRKYDIRLAFKVYLINSITRMNQKESRELRFWFDHGGKINNNEPSDGDPSKLSENLECAQSFFRSLVTSGEFPKNYVGFITKLMKLMQRPEYRPLIQIELEVKHLDEPFETIDGQQEQSCSEVDEHDDSLPGQGPDGDHHHQQLLEGQTPSSPLPPPPPLTEARVLEIIESAYPNPLPIEDIASAAVSGEDDVRRFVNDLCQKGVARLNELDQVVRVTSDELQVKRVRQMPEVGRSNQPTVAIITAQFCEKLAVDAMIENKDTYVRYKCGGESNVYTLGNIGPHRVVATKLPAVGNSRSAMIAAGNTTTRLLGIFQHVEYVFLVGIGGGVPHYTDPREHVRLGDVVVSSSPRRSMSNGQSDQSKPPTRTDYIYVHCEKLRSSPDKPINATESSWWQNLQSVDSFNYRFWCPLSLELQDIARTIHQEATPENPGSWEKYLEEARIRLQESNDLEFSRPPSSTDKLFMSVGKDDLIEMAHPEIDDDDNEDDPRRRGMPRIHFGVVGSGRKAIANEKLRQDIAIRFGIKAFDIEFDTVIESIFGNRKDRYIIIRGISDYKDGSRKKDWQPYAALSAAAYMKSILCRLPP